MGKKMKNGNAFKNKKSFNFNLELRNSIILLTITTIFVYLRFYDLPTNNKIQMTSEQFRRVQEDTSLIKSNITTPHSNITILTRVDRCNTSDIDIIFMVKSALPHFDHRQAIRETWGKEDAFAPYIVSRTVFLLGLGGNKDNEEEIEKHQDIVVGDFQDTYSNLTFKACMALNWARNHCFNSKFYALTDDDIYVNPDNLMRYLKSEIKDVNNKYSEMYLDDRRDKIEQERFIGGHLYAYGSKPVRDRDNLKYYISEDVYPYEEYPPYIIGPMSVMSQSALVDFVKVIPITKHIHMDDVYLGLLANKVGIQPRQIPDVIGNWLDNTDNIEYLSKVVSRHYVSADVMRKVWDIVHPTNENIEE